MPLPGLEGILSLTARPSRLENAVLPVEECLDEVRFSFLHRDGRRSIPLGGHGRSISLCHERANSPAPVRNLCDTHRDGASGDHVARRGLRRRACTPVAGDTPSASCTTRPALARRPTPSDAASNGEIGLGVLMILVGLIFIGIKVVFALFVTLGVALMLAGILGRMRRPRLTGRLLALSFDEFQQSFRIARAGRLDPAR